MKLLCVALTVIFIGCGHRTGATGATTPGEAGHADTTTDLPGPAVGSEGGPCRTGGSCDDGLTCQLGTCLKSAGSDVCTCPDDGDPCTIDQCDAGNTCSHMPDPTACADVPETQSDVPEVLTDVPDAEDAPACACPDDGDPCTTDNCDDSGVCVHLADPLACPDAADIPDTPDSLDAADAPDQLDPVDAPDEGDSADAPDELEVSDGEDVSDAPEELDLADAPDELDASDAPDAQDVSGCTPQCAGKCGGDDSCNGTCPETCSGNAKCSSGTWTCEISACTVSGDCPSLPCQFANCTGVGTCNYTYAIASCDDGDGCTVDDACNNGACSGLAKDCSDGVGCTIDSCSGGNCGHVADDSACPSSGCSVQFCDIVNGCDAKSNVIPACDDGDKCTVGDVCSANDANASCLPGAATSCEDGNACTADACDPASGCINLPVAATCTDGSACTVGDSCAGGACVPGVLNCDDGNVCTDDACAAAGTCAHVPNSATCGANAGCAAAATCAGGICPASTPSPCCGLSTAEPGTVLCTGLSTAATDTDILLEYGVAGQVRLRNTAVIHDGKVWGILPLLLLPESGYYTGQIGVEAFSYESGVKVSLGNTTWTALAVQPLQDAEPGSVLLAALETGRTAMLALAPLPEAATAIAMIDQLEEVIQSAQASPTELGKIADPGSTTSVPLSVDLAHLAILDAYLQHVQKTVPTGLIPKLAPKSNPTDTMFATGAGMTAVAIASDPVTTAAAPRLAAQGVGLMIEAVALDAVNADVAANVGNTLNDSSLTQVVTDRKDNAKTFGQSLSSLWTSISNGTSTLIGKVACTVPDPDGCTTGGQILHYSLPGKYSAAGNCFYTETSVACPASPPDGCSGKSVITHSAATCTSSGQCNYVTTTIDCDPYGSLSSQCISYTCVPSTKKCGQVANTGADCMDGSPCGVALKCGSNGYCGGHPYGACDDDNPCTLDKCQFDTLTCTHTAVQCNSSECVASKCDSNLNQPTTGKCVNTYLTGSCGVNGTCVNGYCVP